MVQRRIRRETRSVVDLQQEAAVLVVHHEIKPQ
jgi:hypothetical protein